MDEAGGKITRNRREGATWSGIMIGLRTNLLYQKNSEVNERALIVVSEVRISQRSDPPLYVVQSIGHSLIREDGKGAIFAFKLFNMPPWLL